jgi:hypothetical protein
VTGGLYGFGHVDPSKYKERLTGFRNLLPQRHRSLYVIPLRRAVMKKGTYELLGYFQLKTCENSLKQSVLSFYKRAVAFGYLL